jgi:hypothetical protein
MSLISLIDVLGLDPGVFKTVCGRCLARPFYICVKALYMREG